MALRLKYASEFYLRVRYYNCDRLFGIGAIDLYLSELLEERSLTDFITVDCHDTRSSDQKPVHPPSSSILYMKSLSTDRSPFLDTILMTSFARIPPKTAWIAGRPCFSDRYENRAVDFISSDPSLPCNFTRRSSYSSNVADLRELIS